MEHSVLSVMCLLISLWLSVCKCVSFGLTGPHHWHWQTGEALHSWACRCTLVFVNVTHLTKILTMLGCHVITAQENHSGAAFQSLLHLECTHPKEDLTRS